MGSLLARLCDWRRTKGNRLMEIDLQLLSSLAWWQWIIIYVVSMYLLGIAMIRREYRISSMNEADALGLWLLSPIIAPLAVVIMLITTGVRKEKE